MLRIVSFLVQIGKKELSLTRLQRYLVLLVRYVIFRLDIKPSNK